MNRTADPCAAAFNCPNCGAAVNPDTSTCIYCRSPIAARICPSCFGSVAVGMKHCPLCGADLTNSTLSNKESPLECPLCETELSLIKAARHSLHSCVRCGGLWIDKHSFQDICTREEEQEAVLQFRHKEDPQERKAQRKRKRAYIPCPVCRKLMNHKNFSRGSGIILDWCRDHGSWFDRRELQQIIAFIRKGGLRKARERERMNISEEKARLRMKQYELTARANRMDTYPGGMLGFDPSGDSFLQFLHQTFFD